MKLSVIDNLLKWFFIFSSIFYFYSFTMALYENKPYFEYLISFLIESVAVVYFLKKPHPLWIKENMFFLLATMTGLMITKSFVFYYHGLDYELPSILSVFLIFFSWMEFKKYAKNTE